MKYPLNLNLDKFVLSISNKILRITIEILIIWISRIQNMWIYCSTWGFIFCYIKLLIKPSDFSPRSYYSYCVYNWFHKSKILDKPSSWATVLPIDCGRVLGNSHEYSRFLKYMIFKKKLLKIENAEKMHQKIH